MSASLKRKITSGTLLTDPQIPLAGLVGPELIQQLAAHSTGAVFATTAALMLERVHAWSVVMNWAAVGRTALVWLRLHYHLHLLRVVDAAREHVRQRRCWRHHDVLLMLMLVLVLVLLVRRHALLHLELLAVEVLSMEHAKGTHRHVTARLVRDRWRLPERNRRGDRRVRAAMIHHGLRRRVIVGRRRRTTLAGVVKVHRRWAALKIVCNHCLRSWIKACRRRGAVKGWVRCAAVRVVGVERIEGVHGSVATVIKVRRLHEATIKARTRARTSSVCGRSRPAGWRRCRGGNCRHTRGGYARRATGTVGTRGRILIVERDVAETGSQVVLRMRSAGSRDG